MHFVNSNMLTGLFFNWSYTYFEVLCQVFYTEQFGPFPAIFIDDASLYEELEVINTEPEQIYNWKRAKPVFSLDWSWVTQPSRPCLCSFHDWILNKFNPQVRILSWISILFRYLQLRHESKDLYWKSSKNHQGRSHHQAENEGWEETSSAPRREGRISLLNSKEGTVVFHHQIPHQFYTLALLIKIGN